MLSFGPATQIFLYAGVADMRCSFNGLSTLVRNELREDPLSGHVFGFSNRRRNLVKLIIWDRGGYWVFSKRLEKGTFSWPRVGASSHEFTQEELTLLLGGIDLEATRRRNWHEAERMSM
jgi:transposase